VRGAGTIAIGLPLLDAMLDDNGVALADGAPIPKRYVVCFGGFSLGCDRNPTRAAFVPTRLGAGYDLRTATMPLAMHGDVRNEISILSNLTMPHQASRDAAAPIPPGGATAIFHFHNNPLLTGNRSEPWVAGDITNSTVTGPTSDQIAGEHLGGRVLTYRVQPRYYNAASPPEGQDILSYRRDASGAVRPVSPEFSPRLAYDNLFLGFDPGDPALARAQALELRRRQSVLDLVDRRIGGLLPRLGANDRIRVQRHYDEVRLLEQQLQAIDPPESSACVLPPDPGTDAPIGGDHRDPFGGGYVTSAGYSNEEARARAFADILAMAMTCDMTRAASLMYTMFQSYMNAEPLSGVTRTLHGINHAGTPAELETIIAWHMKHFGYFVSRLRDTAEGTGSVLDNSAVLFLIEGGHGNQPETGMIGSHSYENMCALIAGGAGGLRRGEHIAVPSGTNHPVQVMLSLFAATGVPVSTMGEVSGTIPELFA
jgi:hypothetical protein